MLRTRGCPHPPHPHSLQAHPEVHTLKKQSTDSCAKLQVAQRIIRVGTAMIMFDTPNHIYWLVAVPTTMRAESVLPSIIRMKPTTMLRTVRQSRMCRMRRALARCREMTIIWRRVRVALSVRFVWATIESPPHCLVGVKEPALVAVKLSFARCVCVNSVRGLRMANNCRAHFASKRCANRTIMLMM